MTFEEKLRNYAELIVNVGANVQKGQNVMFRAPVEGAELARLVVESAYAAGARYVDLLWNDDAVTLSHFKHAADDTFDELPAWLRTALNGAAERGDAFIEIRATDPSLLQEQDSSKVARASKARREALQPFMNAVTSSGVNWCLVTMPIEAWAKKVFPKTDTDEALQNLWEAVFKAVRADLADPVNEWQKHLEQLEQRRRYLTAKQYKALHYRAPGTDLRVGLPRGHIWFGGTQPTKAGTNYVANLPTEEVFTLPHKDCVDGVVKSSLPLSYNGKLIEDFEFTFDNGKVTDVKAAQGEESLRSLLATDEGAKRLGEVALVPFSSPISQMGTLFYNTLYDENASSHLALGRAYAFTIENGAQLSSEEALAAGVNDSLEHVDFMIGSKDMDIDGVTDSDEVEAVMRGGEWAF